jgi:hypothetical protein
LPTVRQCIEQRLILASIFSIRIKPKNAFTAEQESRL